MQDNKENEIKVLDDEMIDIQNKIIEYINAYDNFINKIAYSVNRKCPKLEFEDIKQQILLALFTNVNTFDETRNASANTYFSQIALNAANNIIKKYWQIKNKINVECVSLDSYIKENDEHSGQFVNIFPEANESSLHPENYFRRNDLIHHIHLAMNNLTPFERKVFLLYMDGYSIDEIALKVKKTKKTIYNVLRVIKEKIKNSI